MSDFDDEPTEGREATDEADDAAGAAVAADEPPKKASSQPIPDDDWDDDWDDEDTGRDGKRDLTVVYAIVAAAIVIVLAVVLTRPSDDNAPSTGNGDSTENAGATTAPVAPVKNWQGPVGDAVGKDGADAQERAESAPGIYIWTDFGGWHIRSNNTQPASITVTADKVRQGSEGDFATETVVELPAGDGKTGADLDLGDSESATFVVKVDGTNVPADQIFLGGAEGVAEANPVTFTKS